VILHFKQPTRYLQTIAHTLMLFVSITRMKDSLTNGYETGMGNFRI